MDHIRDTATASSAWRLLYTVPVVVLCLLGSNAAEAAPVEGCIDPMTLSMSMSLADASYQMSVERLASLSDSLPTPADRNDDDLFEFGMSCDGPSSCSPRLVLAPTESADPDTDDAPSPGPMCLPGSADCDLTPGEAPGNPHVELSQTLTPYIQRTDHSLGGSDASEATLRLHPRVRTLSPREIARRIDRPPRT